MFEVTIRRLEAERDDPRVAPDTVDAIRRVLEASGAEFINAGVRRRRHGGGSATELIAELHRISTASAALLAERDMLTEADLYDKDGLPA